MKLKSKVKMFRYSRGDKYSVDITVNNKSTLIYSNVIVPAGTSSAVKLKLLEDAERAVMNKLDNEYISESLYGAV